MVKYEIKMNNKRCIILFCVILSVFVIIFIGNIILRNKEKEEKHTDRVYDDVDMYIKNNCFKYYDGRYEYLGYSIFEEKKSIRVSFNYINRDSFDKNSIYEIYNVLYEYFCCDNKYDNYSLNILFGISGISFNIFDITKDKSNIRIVCDEPVKLGEIAELYPETTSIMCEHLLYDSIEEISAFNNLQSIYFDCAITGEERWKILREFPRCEITVDEMNDKKDDEDTSEPEPFEGYYEYAITDEPLTEENIEKCRISYEVLETMTTEQVAQAVVDYPFIDELYSASQETFDAMILRRNCDAYAEILMRKDGREELVDKILESENGDYNIDLLKKIVLSEKLYADEFTEDELYFLDYFTND